MTRALRSRHSTPILAEVSLSREDVLAARPSVPEHVVYREFVQETVILNLETGTYHGLNPSGGKMLETLGAAATPRTTARRARQKAASGCSRARFVVGVKPLLAEVSQFGALHVYYGDNGNYFDYAKFIRVAGQRRGTGVLERAVRVLGGYRPKASSAAPTSLMKAKNVEGRRQRHLSLSSRASALLIFLPNPRDAFSRPSRSAAGRAAGRSRRRQKQLQFQRLS